MDFALNPRVSKTKLCTYIWYQGPFFDDLKVGLVSFRVNFSKVDT